MKKKHLLFLASVLTVCAMTLTFTACGGSDDDDNGGGNSIPICIVCNGSGQCKSCSGSGVCQACHGENQEPYTYWDEARHIWIEVGIAPCGICHGTQICMDCGGTCQCSNCEGTGYSSNNPNDNNWGDDDWGGDDDSGGSGGGGNDGGSSGSKKDCKFCLGSGQCREATSGVNACWGDGVCRQCFGSGWDGSHGCTYCNRPGGLHSGGDGKCGWCGGSGKCSHCGGTGYR